MPRRVYAERVTASADPIINGVIENDYVRPSKVKLPNLDDRNARPAELLLQSLDSGKYVFALRMPKGTSAASELELAFDVARDDTMAAKVVAASARAPGRKTDTCA